MASSWYTFLSTLSLRRATPRGRFPVIFYLISIHALLAESDTVFVLAGLYLSRFLSTLSLRRATLCLFWLVYIFRDFYPRSPCGERLGLPVAGRISRRISIHALLAESDNRYGRPIDVQFVFLSTLSLRRATTPTSYWRRQKLFLSTLSLRRATFIVDGHRVHITHFYPRSPCGERPYGRINDISRLIFLSTLSLRRATTIYMRSISRHLNFYPRSPCGERPSKRCAETGKR